MDPFRRRTPLWIHLVGAAVFVAAMIVFMRIDSLPGPEVVWLIVAVLISGLAQELLDHRFGKGRRGGASEGAARPEEVEK